MQTFILIGREKDGKVSNLYTGLDGVELDKCAEKAAACEKYSFIGKIVNPSCTPMPLVAHKTVGTKPTFVKLKAHKVETTKPDNSKIDKLNKSAQNPLDKFNAPMIQSVEKSGLRTDGPTLEEFVAEGYKPENYPPVGFAEKESAGLTLFKSGNKTPKEAVGQQPEEKEKQPKEKNSK